jgi:chaperonin GroEL (HSP60 family)
MPRVGGATEVEVRERKDRVDDRMRATRAAIEAGWCTPSRILPPKRCSCLNSRMQ